MLKKSRKVKKSTEPKFEVLGWNTSDAEEIERRRYRGKTEKFRLENLESRYPYYSSFAISSTPGQHYRVEVRSLTDTLNSCNCPDYRSNGLGTCKHIEHVLFRLRKNGIRVFQSAEKAGNPRVEIFFDTRKDPKLCILWPAKTSPHLKELFAPFFSTDGSILGNPLTVYPKLQQCIAENKQCHHHVRLSQHIDYFMDIQSRALSKKSAKEIFLIDVAQGKRSMDIVNFPLYPYQKDGMMHLAFMERALLADEMGLGKTVQAIAACELLRQQGRIQRVLVVATASLKTEWEEQIQKFTSQPSLLVQGLRKNRLVQYQQDSFFYLTNYEQVVMDGAEIQRLLNPDVIILDEAQRIKNWQTKTAAAVKQLKSRYAFVLTGTPLENKIDDVYSIVQFLDPHLFGALFRFNRDFYELDEKGKAVGYKNLDELHRRLKPIMLRRRKSDIEGELPARTVNNYFVGMDEEQMIRYDEYKDYVARLLAQAKRRPLRKEEYEKLQKFLSCMRMLCDTPYILDPECKVSPKIRELEIILDELLADPSAKVIIFSEWARMLELVRESAKKKEIHIAWHTGSVHQSKRREEINRFKNDPECRLFLSTDSGSVGLNLQAANIVINLDLPWNPAKLEQRIARAWRKHQTRSVQVINLVCQDSIEHRMLSLLAQKQNLAEGVLEGADDLKEMKLPSGRVAFMERMESLLGDVSLSQAPKEHSVKNNESSAEWRNEILNQWRDTTNLIQIHLHRETGKPTVLAVTEKPENIISPSKEFSLEMIDQKTFELMQRLAQAGVISFNQPLEVLHTAGKVLSTQKKRREKNIQEAKKLLAYSLRKQKMAQVLIQSDFHEESISPLKEALNANLHAFAWISSEGEYVPKENLSLHFVQETLVNQYGLPDEALTLFIKLYESTEEAIESSKIIFAQQEKIYEYVDQALNKVLL